MDYFSLSMVSAFVQVVFIDIALAADNAVVVGLAAAGLERAQRKKAIFWGIIAATGFRIVFASVAVQLLAIIGLVLAGGFLLLWVCWKMWAELHPAGVRAAFADWRIGRAVGPDDVALEVDTDRESSNAAEQKTLKQAIIQIVIADLSMSLDNVIAVAGAAREHPVALIFGLILSIGLMGTAAIAIARLLERHKWIAYVGLAIVLYVALRMIAEGGEEVLDWVLAS